MLPEARIGVVGSIKHTWFEVLKQTKQRLLGSEARRTPKSSFFSLFMASKVVKDNKKGLFKILCKAEARRAYKVA